MRYYELPPSLELKYIYNTPTEKYRKRTVINGRNIDATLIWCPELYTWNVDDFLSYVI